jgi:hypothetical protein
MTLKDASFLIRIYSFLMRNNKVRSPLTDMINILYDATRNSIVNNKTKIIIHNVTLPGIVYVEKNYCDLFSVIFFSTDATHT